MPGRASRCRSSTGSRPPPPPAVVAARIEQHTGPGDVVADLFGRGGWVARAAVDRQRLTVSLESSPLSRMLAEVVLRPPDVRHLDAAFQGMAASPRGEFEPQGLDRRPVRDPLRDLRPDPRRRRDRLVGRRRGRHRRAGPTGHPALPLHGLPRPARRLRAAPGAARRRRPAAGHGRCRRRGDAREPARPLPDRDRAPRACPTSCSTSTRGASWSAWARSSSGSRATSAPRRSWPRFASRSSTRSCRPAGSRPSRGERAPCASSSGHVRPQRGRSCASATRGSPSRTRSGWSAGSSSASTAGRPGPIQARLGEDLRSLGRGVGDRGARA